MSLADVGEERLGAFGDLLGSQVLLVGGQGPLVAERVGHPPVAIAHVLAQVIGATITVTVPRPADGGGARCERLAPGRTLQLREYSDTFWLASTMGTPKLNS